MQWLTRDRAPEAFGRDVSFPDQEQASPQNRRRLGRILIKREIEGVQSTATEKARKQSNTATGLQASADDIAEERAAEPTNKIGFLFFRQPLELGQPGRRRTGLSPPSRLTVGQSHQLQQSAFRERGVPEFAGAYRALMRVRAVPDHGRDREGQSTIQVFVPSRKGSRRKVELLSVTGEISLPDRIETWRALAVEEGRKLEFTGKGVQFLRQAVSSPLTVAFFLPRDAASPDIPDDDAGERHKKDPG